MYHQVRKKPKYEKDWFDIDETARYLNVPRETLMRSRRYGGGPPSEIRSGRVRYRVTDLICYSRLMGIRS
jgi:hypothetical protein